MNDAFLEFVKQHAIALSVASLSFLSWKVYSTLVDKRGLANVPGPKRSKFWMGNFAQFINRDGWGWHADLYKNYGGAVRVEMPFGEQFLYISDPLALQHICVKDQNNYDETEMFLLQFHLLFGKCLLSCLGDEHKKQRKMLNPIFAPKHMRELYPVFQPIADEIKAIIEGEVKSGKEYVDIMNWTSRAALEYVGRGGLGYNFEALDKNEQRNEYSEAIKTLTPLLFRLAFLRMFVPYLVKLGPPSFRRWLIDLIPTGSIREITDVVDTIEKSTSNIYENKKRAIEKGEIVREAGQGKDIISVLMRGYESKNEKVEAQKIPEHEMLAHMSSFIIAGHETTSSGMSTLFYVLAQHPEVQKKLRDEVRAARKENNGELDYDTLMNLPYVDAVVRETMRVYPPAPMLDRVAVKDSVLPLAFPETSADGKKELKEIIVKKGTNIFISIIGANRNKKVWGEDAEEWKPERWLGNQPQIPETSKFPGVYNQMMTFMGGQRACIGFKFAEMELKLVLATLTEHFQFAPGPDIYWAMGNVQLPFLKNEESSQIQMPLKVTIAE